jgi:hypothetical protein
MSETKIVKVVYKGAHTDVDTPCIIALGIPKDAEVVVPQCNGNLNKKQRANKAVTLAIASISLHNYRQIIIHSKRHQSADSLFYKNYKYTVGHLQEPQEEFDSSVFNICTSGIHFFESMRTAAIYAVFSDMANGYGLLLKDSEQFATFAEEQAERYNNKKP